MYDKFIMRLREKAGAFDYDGWVETASDYEQAADAIEELQKRVPKTPHGRCIDADAFLMLCKDYAITPSDDEFCKRLEYALTKAPTIIPAEEGE